MACDDQSDFPARKRLSHNPMTATAPTHETDFVGLPPGTEEEAVLPTSPPADHDSGGSFDSDLVDHRARCLNGLGL